MVLVGTVREAGWTPKARAGGGGNPPPTNARRDSASFDSAGLGSVEEFLPRAHSRAPTVKPRHLRLKCGGWMGSESSDGLGFAAICPPRKSGTDSSRPPVRL